MAHKLQYVTLAFSGVNHEWVTAQMPKGLSIVDVHPEGASDYGMLGVRLILLGSDQLSDSPLVSRKFMLVSGWGLPVEVPGCNYIGTFTRHKWTTPKTIEFRYDHLVNHLVAIEPDQIAPWEPQEERFYLLEKVVDS